MRKNNKIKWRFNIHLFLIMFASVFMTIGFAAISAVNLSVVGNAVASAQSGVFISDATCNSGGTPSSSIDTLTSYINFRFVDSTAPPDVKLVDALNALVSGATPTNGVYTIGSNGASGCFYKLAFDTDNNLRYVGSNPCNYVTFNGETWRIIGVISGMVDGNGNTLQLLIKLISTSKYNNATTTVFNSYPNQLLDKYTFI